MQAYTVHYSTSRRPCVVATGCPGDTAVMWNSHNIWCRKRSVRSYWFWLLKDSCLGLGWTEKNGCTPSLWLQHSSYKHLYNMHIIDLFLPEPGSPRLGHSRTDDIAENWPATETVAEESQPMRQPKTNFERSLAQAQGVASGYVKLFLREKRIAGNGKQDLQTITGDVFTLTGFPSFLRALTYSEDELLLLAGRWSHQTICLRKRTLVGRISYSWNQNAWNRFGFRPLCLAGGGGVIFTVILHEWGRRTVSLLNYTLEVNLQPWKNTENLCQGRRKVLHKNRLTSGNLNCATEH
jgi:hypothetical protein